jgi:small subunit ribosomal protein S2
MTDFANLPNHAPEYDLAQLLEAGCHFGHQTRKWHPAMKEWIYMEKDGVHIFDLAKTAQQLQFAYNYAYDLAQNGKTLVFVGTKRQAREIVQAAATDAGALYINSRWLGGLLTNWEQVSKSLRRMIQIEEGLANDTFKGYTKFEKLQLEKEANRLNRFFKGLKPLKNKPDALFIVDPSREKNAVKEAEVVGVTTVALVDSNTDPRPINLAIPANDDALTSIELVVKAVAEGYKAGKAASGKTAAVSKSTVTK